ncbi:MAG: MarR family winged helix-turn-helix transcriptional regulator [Planctomycetaceae bacterium]|jgi:DNA-binding MarR family transcriptional regulator
MTNTSSRRSATTRFDSLEQEAFLSLWRTYDRLRALEDDFFRPYDLTPQQYNVLRLLKAQHPGLLPTLDVANRLVSRAPDITRMLDKLAQRGLVSRVRSESDRRTVLVGITPAGVQMLAEMHEPLRACHEQQLGHLPPEALQQLIELLRQVRGPHEPQESPWH